MWPVIQRSGAPSSVAEYSVHTQRHRRGLTRWVMRKSFGAFLMQMSRPHFCQLQLTYCVNNNKIFWKNQIPKGK
jgi:hypothetical protein